MKKIKLTFGQFALVDDDDFDYLNQWKWHAAKRGNSFYAIRSERGGEKELYMHKCLMGEKDGLEIDHINHNPLDNRRINLRHVTRAQNAANNLRGEFLRGITRHKCGKWQAQKTVTVKSGREKVIYLGLFERKEDAKMAFDKYCESLTNSIR